MKIKHRILLTALLAVAALSSVLYTACKKDKCDNVICYNLGACNNGTCKCPTGFEGSHCDTLSRNKFIYTFNGGDSCGATEPRDYTQFPLKFLTIDNKPLEMVMRNFRGNPDDSALCTMTATDSFIFNGTNNATSFTGYGVLRHDSLHVYYSVVHDTSAYNCVYFGQKR